MSDMPRMSCGAVTFADVTPSTGMATKLVCNLEGAAAPDDTAAGLATDSTPRQLDSRNVGGCISMTFDGDRTLTQVTVLMTTVDAVCGLAKCTTCGTPTATLWWVGTSGTYHAFAAGIAPSGPTPQPFFLTAMSEPARAVVICRAGLQASQADIALDYLGATCL
jgi:hypothetical protein